MIKCPNCNTKMKSYKTYTSVDGTVVRYKKCPKCNHRRITEEMFREDVPNYNKEVYSCIEEILKTLKMYGFVIEKKNV